MRESCHGRGTTFGGDRSLPQREIAPCRSAPLAQRYADDLVRVEGFVSDEAREVVPGGHARTTPVVELA
jgi:hypothetical protein